MGSEKESNFTKDDLIKCIKMLKGLLLIKIASHKYKLEYMIKICQKLNEKIKPGKIPDEEFNFTFDVAQKLSNYDKIIIPKFEADNIIYCFIQYEKNDKYILGPLFKNKHQIEINKKFVKEITSKNSLSKMADYIDYLGKEIYENYFHYCLEDSNERKDLIKVYESKANEKNIPEDIKESIRQIIESYKIAEHFDSFISLNKEKNLYFLDLTDMKMFHDINSKKIAVFSCTIPPMNKNDQKRKEN